MARSGAKVRSPAHELRTGRAASVVIARTRSSAVSDVVHGGAGVTRRLQDLIGGRSHEAGQPSA